MVEITFEAMILSEIASISAIGVGSSWPLDGRTCCAAIGARTVIMDDDSTFVTGHLEKVKAWATLTFD